MSVRDRPPCATAPASQWPCCLQYTQSLGCGVRRAWPPPLIPYHSPHVSSTRACMHHLHVHACIIYMRMHVTRVDALQLSRHQAAPCLQDPGNLEGVQAAQGTPDIFASPPYYPPLARQNGACHPVPDSTTLAVAALPPSLAGCIPMPASRSGFATVGCLCFWIIVCYAFGC